MDDLLQEFIAETRETLEALAGEIVAWEANPADRDRLDAIFRFVHTVKGSCGFLDLPRLARLSHAAEDALSVVRAGERTPDAAMVDAVLAIVDRIGELVDAIETGVAVDDSTEDALIAALAEGASPTLPVAQSVATKSASRSVRLSVDLLDRMMNGMSDLVLARNELARRLRDDGADPQVEASLERLTQTLGEMRDTVTRTRMQRIDALFSALPRVVRDTAAEVGKSVTLHIDGADVELDRELIEMIRDPLLHIVRNAIDHGIETPALRRAAGKRENGRLSVSARQAGNRIVIEVADDGAGIDTARLASKAIAAGRSDREVRAMDQRALTDLIFEPGLTTKDAVTGISGRGVGMDVVRANVEQIGGRIDLANAPGRGLTILIHIPLTLSIISTIGVGVAGQRFALPRTTIEEIVSARGKAIRIDAIGDARTVTVRDRRVPLVDLRRAMGLPPAEPEMLVLIAIPGMSFALGVDRMLDHEELVIKPAAPAVMAAGLYAGETLPDTGLPMLLLDCAGIAAAAGLRFERAARADEDDVGADLAPIEEALLFEDLDGVRRLMPLGVIDRIEPVTADRISGGEGSLRYVSDDRIIPLVTAGPLSRDAYTVLRLRDGNAEIGYLVAEASDIVAMPAERTLAACPGPVSGVVLIDNAPVEMIDVHWLFAGRREGRAAGDAPVCQFVGSDTDWMRTFLGPVLEAAGYRVVNAPMPGERPAVALTMDDGIATVSGPMVRLRRDLASGPADAVYRYDRDGVLAAVGRAVQGGRQ